MANKKIFFVKNNEQPYVFFLNLPDSLTIQRIKLRSEKVYDNDLYAEKTAIRYFENIAHCYEGKVYLFTASQDIAPSNKLRFKKWILSINKDLCDLNSCNNEIIVGNDLTRLASLVDLEDYTYNVSEKRVLNWMFSFIILTDLDIQLMNGYAEKWIQKQDKSILPFDFNAVIEDLSKLDSTIIVRYFPADNGQNETIIFVGNKNYINTSFKHCLKLLEV